MLTTKGRLFVVNLIFALLFFLIIVRIFFIQVFDVFGLYDISKSRYIDSKRILYADRGIIYDCNGNAFTENQKYFKLELFPSLTKWTYKDSTNKQEKNKIYQKIAKIVSKYLNKSEKYYLEKIYQNIPGCKNESGFEFVRNINANTKENILSELKRNKITGLRSYKLKPQERVYPQNGLAGPLIGLYSEKNGGLCGIEGAFDENLTGEDGWEEVVRYGTGAIRHFSDMNIQKPINGNSVYLTIDAHIQAILENNLKKGIEDYKAKNAIGIIISPKNGDILAMSGISSENIHSSTHKIHSMPIYPISWQYEPGSTMKPFTALTAIEKNIFRSKDLIDCEKRIIGRRTIKDVHEYNDLSFKDVIVFSSNVGITRVADELRENELYSKLIDFGFRHKTGVKINDENSGVLRHPTEWSDYSLHSIAFGQEISVTPIQLVYAYAAIANGGKILYPQIVKKIVDADGKIIFKSEKKIVRKVSNEKALDTLKTFLKDVVEYGTGKPVKSDYVSIAAKTGTAEKSQSGKKGYDKKDNYISSIVGFFPVENPQVVMLIIFDEPDYIHRYGSTSAAPTFKKILDQMLVLPNSNLITKITIDNKQIIVPDCIGLKICELKKILSSKNISFSIIGKGEIVTDQFPKPGSKIFDNYAIQLIADLKKNSDKI